MARRSSTRGQSATEYLLLLCSVLFVTQFVGLWLTRYLPQITERLLERILYSALTLGAL